MVLPPGSSFVARSWSMWIHCSSQLASAKRLIRSWVISTQSLTPISVPIAAFNSLKSLKMRMSEPLERQVVRSDLHFRNVGRNEDIRLRYRQDLRDGDARGGFLQRYPSAGKTDHGHIRDDQIDRPGRGQRKSALLDDLRLAFCGMLHGDDDALCTAHQVHCAAHSRHHFGGDHPVRQVPFSVDLKAAKNSHVHMPAADQPERHRAVEDASAG